MIENFGKNVARLRKEKGMTQIKLGEEAGMNSYAISKIERGKEYPNFNNLEKLSRVLEADGAQLFGEVEEK